MKNIKIILLMISSALMINCGGDGDGSNGMSIVVSVEGTDVTFVCNRNYNSGGDEYSIGCQHGESARLNFHKGFDANNNGTGILKITYTDVPNTAFFDSAYGIHYSCDTVGSQEPLCTNNQPTFDSATSTLTLTGVTLPAGENNTDQFDIIDIGIGDGVYVDGRVSTTISTTIVLDDVPYFQ